MGRKVSGEHHAEELSGHLGVVEGAVGAVGLEGDATPVGSLLELDRPDLDDLIREPLRATGVTSGRELKVKDDIACVGAAVV